MSARCLLSALLLLAAVVASTALRTYQYTESKGLTKLRMDHVHGFYIPDDQCSGDLEIEYSDCRGLSIGAVQVNVTDYSPFPSVYIAEEFNEVSITRAPPCAGVAYVKVVVGCRLLKSALKESPQALPPV